MKHLLRALLCGALTLIIDFIAIPKLCVGVPDPIWIALMFLLPALLAAVLLRGAPAWAFAGLLVQYPLLWLGADFFAGLLGQSLSGLGGLAYIFQSVTWPLAVTLVQFALLLGLRKLKRT